MTFIKNLIIFIGIDLAALALKFLFTFLMTFFSDKLEEKSDVISGKTSGFYHFSSILSFYFLTFINNALPASLLLFMLYSWEKVFAVALFIISIFLVFWETYQTYSCEMDFIESGYKSILSHIGSFLIICYISDWIIDFSAFVLMDAFGFDNLVKAIIHIVVFSVYLVLNIFYLVKICKAK